jgi:hypothetical protein
VVGIPRGGIVSALDDFDALADRHGYTLHNLVPEQVMGMTGEDVTAWRMKLIQPDGQKIGFLGMTMDDVIAGATAFIVSKSKTQEES